MEALDFRVSTGWPRANLLSRGTRSRALERYFLSTVDTALTLLALTEESFSTLYLIILELLEL